MFLMSTNAFTPFFAELPTLSYNGFGHIVLFGSGRLIATGCLICGDENLLYDSSSLVVYVQHFKDILNIV